jgi:ABC-type amino acid transport substrate-binding protein
MNASDWRVADLRHAGRMRFGLFPSFFYSKLPNGRLHGVGIEIAKALAARLGVALESPRVRSTSRRSASIRRARRMWISRLPT